MSETSTSKVESKLSIYYNSNSCKTAHIIFARVFLKRILINRVKSSRSLLNLDFENVKTPNMECFLLNDLYAVESLN